MPEERGLYKKMKVGEQLLYLAQLKGLSSKDAKVKLRHWLEKFEILNWWDKKISDLSKGMSQKYNLSPQSSMTQVAIRN